MLAKKGVIVELPKEAIKASRKNPKLFFLYGKEKVGKTTVLSHLDNCLLIDLENGSDYVSALKIKANSLKELGEVGKAILDAKKPYKYVAIDTIDVAEEFAEKKATEDYKRTIIGKNFDGQSILELSKGAGYLYLRQSFFSIVDFLSTLSDNVILVGHSKDSSIDKGGKEVSTIDINLTGKIKMMMAAKSDAIGYVFRQDGKLMITFETKEELTCGSRCDHLKGQTFEFDWNKIFIEK